MTYSLIPPILVVLSLIGIILFLMKKGPEIALLEEKGSIARESRMDRITDAANGTKKRSSAGQYFLLGLEKLTRRFKILMLKLENVFSSWSESLKKKRKGQIVSENEQIKESTIARISERVEIPHNREVTRERLDLRKNREAADTDIRKRTIAMEPKEKIVRPMISEKVVSPRNRAELKGRLEKLLIERIAANPKDVEAYERLGEYYFEINNLEHSKECFKQVIKLDSGNINARAKMRRLESLLRR